MTDKPDRLPSVDWCPAARRGSGHHENDWACVCEHVRADRLDLTRLVLEHLWRGNFTAAEIGDVASNPVALEALLRELEGE